MKIVIAQLNPTIGDLEGNAAKILDAARQSVSEGADLMLTPELALCGYPPRDLLLRPGFIAAMGERLRQLAIALPQEIAVLVGLATANPDAAQQGQKPLFNSAALVQNGTITKVFHKRLLPTYDVFDEDRYFEPGAQLNPFQLGGVTVGVTICEDLWNDEEFWGRRQYEADPIAELTEYGVNFVVNLSASPFNAGKQALREEILRHAAQRYRCPIVYTNQVGGNDDLIFDGSSVAVNRAGATVLRSRPFAPDLALLTYDRDSQDFQPGAIAPPQLTEEAEIWSALVLGVRDYARKCGFTQAVLGLSGGIDSALVAAIAAEALGADNVLGVLMPSPYSSGHSVQDAAALADNLGIRTETLSIGELMGGYDQTLANLFSGTTFGVAEENIQSRIRGNLLMAIANKFGHLLLSTGNKSEMAVGYCTLYGDMNGGLAVIADVPKTQVYALCRWLNRGETPVIPTHIIDKPPSAELKPDQKDADSLPSYEVLDDILRRLIQRHESAADIVAAGHDSQVVERVIHL
ncbi:MAG: NAD+ synthase, partial [Cyanobacteria bacterium P01_H01_bin.119]